MYEILEKTTPLPVDHEERVAHAFNRKDVEKREASGGDITAMCGYILKFEVPLKSVRGPRQACTRCVMLMDLLYGPKDRG